MEQRRDDEVAALLARLDPPPYDEEFGPALWSQIAEEACHRAGSRRRLPRHARRSTVILLSVCLAAAAVALAAATSSTMAKAMPFGVGRELRTLEARNAALSAQLKNALRVEKQHSQAIASAYEQVDRASIDAGAQRAARRAGVASVLASYLDGSAQALLPGAEGQDALARVRKLCTPTCAWPAQLGYVRAAALRSAAKSGRTLWAAGATFGVSDFVRHRSSAVVTIYPLVAYAVWSDGHGGAGHDDVTGVYHVVRLSRIQGRWQVASDSATDPQLPSLLKAGGAPAAMVAAARANLRRLLTPRPAPPGAVATVRRLITLLDRGDFAATAPLFASGRSWSKAHG